jgi:hypothetical protein
MLIAQARDGRQIPLPIPLPTSIRRGIAGQNSAAGRLEEIVCKILKLIDLLVPKGAIFRPHNGFYPCRQGHVRANPQQ